MASISRSVGGKRPNAIGRDASVSDAAALAGWEEEEEEEEEEAGCMCSRLSRTRAAGNGGRN